MKYWAAFLVRVSFGIFSTVLFLTPSLAQQSREELREILQEQFQNPVFIEEAFSQQDIPVRLIPFMREHLNLLFDSPELIDYMSYELWSIRGFLEDFEGAEASAFAERLGLGIVNDLAGAGLRRLPIEDQRRSFIYEVELARELAPRICVNYINGVDLIETRRALNEILSQKDDDFIRDYLSLVRRAVLAELRNEWYSPMIGGDQIRLGFQVLIDEFERVVSEQDRGLEMIDFILGARNTDDPFVECYASLWLLSIAAGIDGSVGDWVVQGISASL